MTSLLQVTGTVEATVDGVPATITGREHAFVVRADRPASLLDSLGLAGNSVRIAASALAETGLQVVVAGPRGDVVTVGAGVHSRLGRLLAGSSRVRPGRPAALLPLVKQRLGARPRLLIGFAAALAAVAAITARRSRR